MTHEREIVEPVDLCLHNGRLNPAAVGWSRRPLHRANLRGWGRNKRWEYWGIVCPSHVIGLTLCSLDYAGLYEISVLDRESGRQSKRTALVPLAWGTRLPDRSGIGTASGRWRDVAFELVSDAAGTSVRVSARGIDVDLDIPRPDGHESLGVVVPWKPNRFQYTMKDVARPVSGRLRIDGSEHRVPEGQSFAVLDHGRGKWPYTTRWNWAAGSGAGGRGIQLGGTWTDGTGMTENAVLVEGRIHKIGQDLRWNYDRSNLLRPWRIEGERVEAEFRPFHHSTTNTNVGVVAGRIQHCVGVFTGWALADSGEQVDLDGLVGWAEEAHQRW